MLQRAIDYANQNPAIIGIVMCGIGAGLLVVLAVSDKRRKKLKRRIRQLKEAIETKERLIAHQQKRIKDLKTEIFALGMDKKISEEKLEKRIQQLEMDKKQLLKWEAEK
jgi:glycerol-3-phosphate cytidylyltransferase-like family protein